MNRRINDYVDGRLGKGELTRLEAHLSGCGECELRIDEVRSVRASVRRLPAADLPENLRIRLRVIASQERGLMIETNGSRLLRAWNNWKFRLNDLMRPFTIPATGGLFSSVALFGAFALTISTTTRVVGYDVPLVYDSERVNANLVPMELSSSVVVTLSTDGNGRITGYAFLENGRSVVGHTAQLQANNISLPSIPSVLRIAQPISSDISISFTPIVYRQ